MQSIQRKIVIAHYRSDIVSGAENSIADFVDQTTRFQFIMLVPGEGNLARFYRKRGFQVWVKHVETPRRLFPGLHQIQSIGLARELMKRNIDAVLCNTFPSASRVGTACRMAHLPYAIYMRDYTPDTPVHRRILNRADMLFAISQDVIQYHHNMAAAKKFFLSYNFINPDPILDRYKAHLASVQRCLPFPPEHPVVGQVGRITPYKQPDLFVRALPFVLDRVPEARFVLIGSAQEREKPYEEKVKALASSIGLDGKVTFLGHRRDAVELTSELTVACLASKREPLGRVVLEANLLGVPVVVPDTGGPAEIVEHEVTGLQFSSTSAQADEQLAGQIVRLLKNPELRDQLAERAREHMQSTFASRMNVEIQEELIEQLCSIHEYQ